MCGRVILDNMFEKGICDPCIVVCPVTEIPQCQGLTASTTQLQQELREYILPYIAEHYSTYAADGTLESLKDARDHFALGGLSNGALFVYEGGMRYDFDLFGSYAAFSGNGEPWVTVTTIKHTKEAFSKLGVDMKNYVYTSMWAEDTSDPVNGTYDVDDSVVGLIRTDKAVISFNGAWAQNIGINETYIDFMGDKGGIRMQYCGGFTYYTARDGALIEEKPTYRMNEMHRDEVLDFVESVRRGERNRNDIRYAVGTSKIMQAIYDSSAQHKEIVL